MNDKRSKKEQKMSFCPVAGKCGGCQLQNMTYERQLGFKEAKVVKLLGKYCHVDKIIGMEHPYHYRNKVQAAFGSTRGGRIISGVYQSKSHRIVCIDSCKIEDRKADDIIVTIRSMMPKYRMTAYNEDRGTGFLRHVLVKRGFKSGEIMVVLVTGTVVFPGKNAFVKELLEVHPEITTIIQNINNSDTSMVLGETEKVLFGKGKITDTLCGCDFSISAKSFYQINPVQTEKLYMKAMDFAGLTGKETVIDAYCGIGTIGIVASKQAKEVIGVEVNRDSVHDAIENAKLNGIKNIRFYCADAGEFMTDMAADGEKADVVFMDPPRAGSDKAFLSSVITLNPKKIVYISCNPETQARDLAYLTRNGYKVKKIQPVDMFPHTTHVETVVLLVRKISTKDYVTVEVRPEELGLGSLKTHGTYEEIKSYVLNKHGLKISTLNISQVKRKCGLDVGEAYNKPKSQNGKVPNCPPEKEKAVIDALKHF
ncbi:MAG: 23S rRNA (uracil(1939)-C(5))-methyltransferase RlmD, partial [Clostridiaceae bacterium]|nr:23S rRNA (uracil(1939)-C(5))-methyltransferase RlmD [Clostridiaceae bacterium]MDY5890177.1 23S rRNA (uracil(1939)-C(5))-methyltransferase RlmD [Oscillospiraceae bacterium]